MKPEVHYRVHNIPPIDPITNVGHLITTYS